MKWRNFPYWVRGGIIGLLISLIYTTATFFLFYLPDIAPDGGCYNLCGLRWIISMIYIYPVYLLSDFIRLPEEFNFGSEVPIVFIGGVVMGFVFGAIVGLIIGFFKIKKRSKIIPPASYPNQNLS